MSLETFFHLRSDSANETPTALEREGKFWAATLTRYVLFSYLM